MCFGGKTWASSVASIKETPIWVSFLRKPIFALVSRGTTPICALPSHYMPGFVSGSDDLRSSENIGLPFPPPPPTTHTRNTNIE